MSERRISDRGRDLLAQWEGIRLEPYEDARGLSTIGVGHLIRFDEERRGEVRIGDRWVPYRKGLSREDAMALLGEDLQWAETVVNERAKTYLNQQQFDALTSFTFNVGASAFIESTLLRRLNTGEYAAVPAELRKWVNAGGERLRGLVNRREHEIALWEGKL